MGAVTRRRFVSFIGLALFSSDDEVSGFERGNLPAADIAGKGAVVDEEIALSTGCDPAVDVDLKVVDEDGVARVIDSQELQRAPAQFHLVVGALRGGGDHGIEAVQQREWVTTSSKRSGFTVTSA